MFAGQLLGLSNSLATIPGIIGNDVTGWILSGHANDWSAVFLLAAAIYTVGALAFLIGGRASPQDF